MSYHLTVSGDNQYLVCRISGAIDAVVARDFCIALDALGLETNIRCYLTDVRNAHNNLGYGENFHFVNSDMTAMGIRRGTRVATLIRPDDKTHQFLETLTHNAGYNMRVFHEEAAAVAWLTAGSCPGQ